MSWTREQRNVTIAAYLGWTLDAFDFFLMVFVLKDIAAEFNTKIPDVAFGIMLTLMMRPVGALIFGWLADRYGRRPTLMVNIACFSLLELLSGFSPNLATLLRAARAVRHCDGRRMGRGRRLDDGDRAAEVARHRLRFAASGLSERLPARVGGVRPLLSVYRLARHVLRRRAAARCSCCTFARTCRNRPRSKHSKSRHGPASSPR